MNEDQVTYVKGSSYSKVPPNLFFYGGIGLGALVIVILIVHFTKK